MLNKNGDTPAHDYTPLNDSDGQINLPDEVSLQSANFVRDGSDLLINTETSHHFVVSGYFSQETLSDLVASDGQILNGQFFDTKSDINAENQYAQAQIPGLETAELNPTTAKVIGEPIGTVDNVEGAASVTHVDGTTEFLQVGDKVYQGDILITETGAGVGITLADTSVFSLGEEGELVLDELVYDPGQEDGQAVLSLVEGTASFVSGQIAKINPDAFSITTPVATIGIRGTKVFVEYKNGEFKAVNLLETTLDGEQAGEIVIFDLNGTPIGSTNEANIGWSWNPSKGETPSSQRFSDTQIETMTRGAVRNLPRSLAEEARDALDKEDALKEAADIAQDEAAAAQEEAALAQQEAELAKEAALKAQAEAEALLAQAALLKEEEELALAAAEAQRLAELELLAAQEAERIALDALAEAERALEAERLAQEAARRAHEDALTAYERATEYTGYSVIGGPKQQEERDDTQIASNIEANDPDVELNSADDDGTSFLDILTQDNTSDTNSSEPETQVAETQEETEEDNSTQQNQEDNSSGQAVNISGTAVDGYLDGATVFIDLNDNGILDAGEDFAITSNGSFTLNTVHTDQEITILGGTDIATGLDFYGALKAPAGSTVITPLTTVLASLMENGQTQAEATQTLASAFGFDSSIDLTNVDPIAGAGAGDTALAEIAAIGVQLQNTIIQAAAVIEGAAGSDLGDASTADSVFKAIANTITSQSSSFDINATSSLTSIIEDAADVAFSNNPTAATNAKAAASDTATLISNSNTVIKNYIADIESGTVTLGNDGGTSFLTSISQVATVANDAVTQLKTIDFTSDTSSAFSTLNASFSADQLDSRIASAEVNDVNGDGVANLKPVQLSGTEDNTLTFSLSDLIANAKGFDEGASLSVSNVKTADGVAVSFYDGMWVYSPASNSTADVTFTYEITDGTKTVATSAVANFTAVNDAPTVSTVSLANGEENTAYTLTGAQLLANASDVDGDNLSVTSVTSIDQDEDFSIVKTRDQEIWTITSGSSGTKTLTFTVSDGTTTVNQTVTLTFDADTDNVLNNDGITLDEDNSGTIINVLANDSILDGNAGLTVSTPSHGTAVVNEDNTITYTPTANYSGSDSFTYTVTDNDGETQTATVNLTVTAINDAPVAGSPVSLSTAEDTSVTITATQLLNGATDADGDSLSIENLAIQSGNGTLTQINDGGEGGIASWSYTPAANDDTDVTFSYDISDGTLSDSTTASLDITPVNDTPVAGAPISLSTVEDTDITITASQLLSGATDQENDSLSVANLAIQSGNGTLTQDQNQDGSISWTYSPAANDDTAVTFSYNITDGNSSASTTASLDITPVNDAPVVNTVSLSAGTEGVSYTLMENDLLQNSSDADNDTLTVTSVTGGSNLTITEISVDPETGEKRWTITSSEEGSETITFTVSDNTTTTQQTATISFTDVDNSLSNDTGTVTEDGSVTLSVLSNDTISDGATITATSSASNGTVVINSNNTLTYTPTADYSGSDTFSYTVTDEDGETQTATVSMTVNADADAPSLSMSLGAGSAVTVQGQTTSTTINVNNMTATDNGYTVTGIAQQNQTASADNLVAHGSPVGIGVTGTQSGNQNEIGYNSFAESLIVDFDNAVSSVSVAFAWLASNETAAYEFFLNGSSVGTGTRVGVTDNIDSAVTLSPSNGSTFDQIVLKPDDKGDDFLVNAITFEQSTADTSYVDIPIYLSASEADSDGSETLSSITLSGIPDSATLYVDGSAVSVSSGSATLANNNLDDVKIRVTDDQDNFDLTASITSTDGSDSATTTQTVNVPDYTFGDNGNDTIAIQSGNVTINGGSGSDTLQIEAGFDPNFTTDNLTLSSIETLDLLTDTTANSLTIGASDIVSMTDNNSLTITGDSLDTLTFSDASGWTEGEGGEGYSTYTYSQGDTTAQVTVNSDVTVTGF